MRNKTAVAGLVIFLALTVFSFIGGFFTQWDKETLDPFNIGMPPSADHYLGTSQAGIDLYAMTVEGTRISILIGLVVGLVSVLIAAVYGCTMAYFGGKVDKVMLFILEALIMMPALLVVAAVAGASILGSLDKPWMKRRLQEAVQKSAGLDVDWTEVRLSPLSGIEIGKLFVHSPLSTRHLAPELAEASGIEARWSTLQSPSPDSQPPSPALKARPYCTNDQDVTRLQKVLNRPKHATENTESAKGRGWVCAPVI